MSKTEESYIEAVTEYLIRPRKIIPAYSETDPEYQFCLDEHLFIINEFEFTDRYTGIRQGRFSIIYPPERLAVCKVYEIDSVSRYKVCRELATKFVKEILPKVDYKFIAQMYNEQLDKTLEVLK